MQEKKQEASSEVTKDIKSGKGFQQRELSQQRKVKQEAEGNKLMLKMDIDQVVCKLLFML